uniref:CRAL-TRIO domain-containing protein n=1 Tax=Timema bartmani TaxID=61472 RepID=A0A7R9ESJ6_9NEOP|nr:unnamed protein product [Timema bartmani]
MGEIGLVAQSTCELMGEIGLVDQSTCEIMGEIGFVAQSTDQSGLNGPRNDFFLLRFLRAKQFDVGAALVLLRNYEGWRKSHGQSWLTIDKSVIQQVLQSGVIQILPEKDDQGRRLFWLRVGLWRPRDFSADTLLQVGALCGELALLDSGTQINGAVAVFDMRGLGLQQLKVVTPAFARKMVHYLADCISLKINAVHVMNDSVLFAMIFAIFKKFLDDSMKKRIFFHGNNMYSLHEHVDSSYLPKELGGELPSQDGAQLLAVISSDAVIKELERIGYTFLEAKQ